MRLRRSSHAPRDRARRRHDPDRLRGRRPRLHSSPRADLRSGGAAGRRGRRRLCRRDLRPRGETQAAGRRRDARRGEPDLHGLPVQQRRHRRPARPRRAAVRLRRRAQGRRRGRDPAGHRGRSQPARDHARRRREARLRPPRARARHRSPLRRARRLHRRRRRGDAACLEGRPADASPAPPARRHGGWRHGRHLGAGEPLPLPARPL